MSLYETFQTDHHHEKFGVTTDYGTTRVTLARAGGANAKYRKVLESLTRPYRRAIETGTLDADVSQKLLAEAYATAIVLNWEVLVDGGWVQGIEGKDGSLEEFNQANVVKIFMDLPDFFEDIQSQATNQALYRKSLIEDTSGN